MTDDSQLLEIYRKERSEGAFSELVQRHIDLVFSAALRKVGGDSHLAQDITQIVFTDLARKAWGLPRDVVLAGWLYRHACFTASKAVRTERRRQAREELAMQMRTLDDQTGAEWERLAPHLDDGLNQLPEADRNALVLRFLQQQDLQKVGAALGISDDAAQKRVSRALEKLRGFLARRGVALTTATVATVLAAGSVTAAPAGLAVSVTATSLAAGAAAGSGFGLLTMKVMAMTKLQLTVAGVLLIAAVATPLVLEHQTLRDVQAENQRLRSERQAQQSQTAEIVALTAENQRLSNRIAQLAAAQPPAPPTSAELLRLRGAVTRLQAEAQAAQSPSNALVDVLRSPQMKSMMKMAMGSAMDRTASRLADRLHLTPQQSAELKDLVLNGALASMDFDALGENNPSKKAELAARSAAERKSIDEKVRQLLGDTYPQYEEYMKTSYQRMLLGSFESQLSVETMITPEQEDRLAEIMAEEQQKSRMLAQTTQTPRLEMASGMDDEKFRQFQQDQEQAQQGMVERAKTVLSKEQLTRFEQFLTDQQRMMATSLQLGAQLMGGKVGGQ